MNKVNRCSFKLKDGAECGQAIRNSDTRTCRFHAQLEGNKIWKSGDSDAIQQYVQNSGHNEIDLANIEFRRVKFTQDILQTEKPIIFSHSSFRNCTFDECKIKNASFDGECEFDQSFFRKCQFNGNKCEFKGATFVADSPPFVECVFELKKLHDLDITSVTFDDCSATVEGSLFRNCYVRARGFRMTSMRLNSNSSSCSFEMSVFEKYAGRNEPILCLEGVREIYISELQVTGTFKYTQFSGDRNYEPELHLVGVKFALMESAEFFNANLRRVSFKHSSLERVRFYSCTWKKEGRYNILPEDITDHASGIKDTEEIVRLYVQLKKSYETNGDFIGASDWYYREMEARRRLYLNRGKPLLRILKPYFGLISLYKGVSDYGENYSRPLCLLIILALSFTFIYLLSGFSVSGEVVNYRFCLDCGVSAKLLNDLAKAFVCSLSAMTLQVGKTVKLEGGWSAFWFSVQLVLTAILVSLFLLALRRKFRR